MRESPEIFVTRGLPGSGKSTWAKEWIDAHREPGMPGRVRVNRDDIRAMMGFWPIGTHEQENIVTKIEEQAVKAALEAGNDVVVDATHLKAQRIRRWYKLGYPVNVVDFPTPIEECIGRDALRKTRVGAEVILSMANRFHVKADGTLPKLPPMELESVPKFAPYVADESLPATFVFDIDGTLAKMGDRSPYDATQYHTDTVHEHVADLLRHLSENFTIVVVTGRDERYRMVTEDWLWYYNLMPHIERVFMRPAFDNRNDAIVKAEILHNELEQRYNVLGVFDDRDRVVAAWREMGIPCYQVAPGAF